MAETLLTLGALAIPAGAGRGITQTLEPIDQAAQMRRTINGTLVDVGLPQFRKYKSTISCTDQAAPALDGIWPGQTLVVGCIATLTAASGAALARTAVGSPIVDSLTGAQIYRPQLTMKVQSIKLNQDEWGASAGWELDLEEV